MMTLRFSLPAVTARPAYDRQLPIPCGPSTDQDHHVTASLKHSRRPPGLSSELRFDSRCCCNVRLVRSHRTPGGAEPGAAIRTVRYCLGCRAGLSPTLPGAATTS